MFKLMVTTACQSASWHRSPTAQCAGLQRTRHLHMWSFGRLCALIPQLQQETQARSAWLGGYEEGYLLPRRSRTSLSSAMHSAANTRPSIAIISFVWPTYANER